MRQIKFRGKHLDNGEWVYGDLIHRVGVHSASYIAEGDGYYTERGYINNETEINPDSVGQFTGLKDAKGKEIYEGDIVMSYVVFSEEEEMTREFWRVGEIRFVAGSFALTNCTNYDDREMTIKSDIQPSKKSKYNFPAYRSQILGNIHDNQELLKGDDYEQTTM